jgi:type IV secretory pathway VirB3-like protein
MFTEYSQKPKILHSKEMQYFKWRGLDYFRVWLVKVIWTTVRSEPGSDEPWLECLWQGKLELRRWRRRPCPSPLLAHRAPLFVHCARSAAISCCRRQELSFNPFIIIILFFWLVGACWLSSVVLNSLTVFRLLFKKQFRKLCVFRASVRRGGRWRSVKAMAIVPPLFTGLTMLVSFES